MNQSNHFYLKFKFFVEIEKKCFSNVLQMNLVAYHLLKMLKFHSHNESFIGSVALEKSALTENANLCSAISFKFQFCYISKVSFKMNRVDLLPSMLNCCLYK